MSEHEFWFCLTHHAVEDIDGCRNADRLGPYRTSSAVASHALETSRSATRHGTMIQIGTTMRLRVPDPGT